MNLGDFHQLQRPTHVPDLADVCLKAIAEYNLGYTLSLGGAFGLLHYLDYRSTYDIDAWWSIDTTAAERQQLIRVIENALRPHGEVRTRSWGEVFSIELAVDGKKHFSFQIAERTIQLEPSRTVQWTNVLLDSFSDLVASKMVALVERGAPRDFRDIYAVCQADLVTPQQCWELWQRRQKLAANNADFQRARLAIETHLTRIERQRPIDKIQEPYQRSQAEAVRNWYKTEFIHVSVD